MQLLLDTHALLWWLADDPQLGRKARAAIGQAGNVVYVSAASVWEIEIKRAIGKLSAPDNLIEAIEASYFEMLPMNAVHATRAGRLPPHHNDPFDRMLIGQAMVEDLSLVSRDGAFKDYGIVTIVADL